MIKLLFALAAAAGAVVLVTRTEPARAQAAEPFAAYEEKIPGTEVTFQMVPVKGGRFTIGSPAKEPGRDEDEGPQRQVDVGSFWMARFEVTWDEYDNFAYAVEVPPPAGTTAPTGADAITRPTPSYGDEARGFGKGKQPVLDVTHHAAMEYTRWLSSITGKAYRLPTEAEWEYAARAGSTAAYSFGANPKLLGDYAWYAGNSEEKPHPVGLKKPNTFGIHDMHGNMSEWVLDQYVPDFYAKLPSARPSLMPVSLPNDRRYPHVARGGSWADDPKELRSAARRASSEEWSRRDPQSPQSIWWHTDATIVGIRVVRAVEERPELRNIRSQVTRNSPDR